MLSVLGSEDITMKNVSTKSSRNVGFGLDEDERTS